MWHGPVNTSLPLPEWKSPWPVPCTVVDMRYFVARSCRWYVWQMSQLAEPFTSASPEAVQRWKLASCGFDLPVFRKSTGSMLLSSTRSSRL